MTQRKTTELGMLQDEYLKCRTYGHSWDQIPSSLADPEYQRMYAWYDVLRCVNCKTERYDGIASSGDVDTRTYRYPWGYGINFALTRSEARVEHLLRTRGRAGPKK